MHKESCLNYNIACKQVGNYIQLLPYAIYFQTVMPQQKKPIRFCTH